MQHNIKTGRELPSRVGVSRGSCGGIVLLAEGPRATQKRNTMPIERRVLFCVVLKKRVCT
jgi:hypothetical protein